MQGRATLICMEISMTQKLAFGLLLFTSLVSRAALAQDEPSHPPFEFETPTALAAIAPGPNVFVNSQGWDKASAIKVYGADDLAFKGTMAAGLQAHSAISRDGQTAYYASNFQARMVRGPRTDVLTVFDIPTLSVREEIVLPTQIAQYTTNQSLTRLSADERFLFIQNSTPATSVTVVDLAASSFAVEVPTPGCFGIYPTLEGSGFSTICADGAFMSVTLDETGKTFTTSRSTPVFDPNKDPLYLTFDRYEGDLYFITYSGAIVHLSDEGGTVKLVETIPSFGADLNWAPGGYNPFTINEAHGVLFMAMKEIEEPGAHYHASSEIWAYDLKARKLLFRSQGKGLSSVFVSDAETPLLYSLSLQEDEIVLYEAIPEAQFALRRKAATTGTGFAAVIDMAPGAE
ncbi:hypothetical protein C8029_08660 [Roseobacter sp. TSBP12]|nr:hypothetical protein C8029_08660 [Roseobacter sp. TSBP12]